MKVKLLIFAVFIVSRISAQKDIKIVKIDNSKFPQIELLIKGNKRIDTSNLKIFEGKQKLNYGTFDVPYKDIKKERRILFLVNNEGFETEKSLLLKAFSKLKKSDKINLGIMFPDKNDKIKVRFASSEFSKNHAFFKAFLSSSKIIEYNETDCKTEKKIREYLFSGKTELKNIGIIIIGDLKNNSMNFCSGLVKESSVPVYVLQKGNLEKEKEDKIIKICMKSGGMYTQSKSEKDIPEILKRYTDDISLDPFNTKSNLRKIIFRISGASKITKITVKYRKNAQQFTITKPKRKQLSDKELFLTIFSSVLLLFIVLLLLKCRKNRKKILKDEKAEPEMQAMNITVPIEINVKGKGINKTYFFEKHLIRIGRNPDNDIVIPDATVSGNHAVINKQGREFLIQDLGSTNGIIVNKKKIKKRILKNKDQIKLGGVVLFVRI